MSYLETTIYLESQKKVNKTKTHMRFYPKTASGFGFMETVFRRVHGAHFGADKIGAEIVGFMETRL